MLARSLGASTRFPLVFGQDDLLPFGGKVRGLNLAPSPTDWTTDSTHVWQVFWRDWDMTWVNACLDDAVEFGANVVRAVGSVWGIYNNWYTRAEHIARWTEMYEAAASRGLRLYPALGGDVGIYSTYASLEEEVTAWAAAIEQWPFRAIGLDVSQENSAWAISANGISLIEAVRAVTSLPLTYSLNDGSPIGILSSSTLQSRMAAIADHVDFFDIHWYHDPAATEIETYYWGNGWTKPIIIGEFGSNQAAGSTANASRYSSVAAVMNHAYSRRPAGALAWCARDWTTDPSNAWGLSTSAGVRRTGMITPFETIPKL